MKCGWCNFVMTWDSPLQMIAIDPIGKKNRTWVCSECMSRLPKRDQKRLRDRGRRRTLMLIVKSKMDTIIYYIRKWVFNG